MSAQIDSPALHEELPPSFEAGFTPRLRCFLFAWMFFGNAFAIIFYTWLLISVVGGHIFPPIGFGFLVVLFLHGVVAIAMLRREDWLRGSFIVSADGITQILHDCTERHGLWRDLFKVDANAYDTAWALIRNGLALGAPILLHFSSGTTIRIPRLGLALVSHTAFLLPILAYTPEDNLVHVMFNEWVLKFRNTSNYIPPVRVHIYAQILPSLIVACIFILGPEWPQRFTVGLPLAALTSAIMWFLARLCIRNGYFR